MTITLSQAEVQQLGAYWQRIRGEILGWKLGFNWPDGVGYEAAIGARADLETQIQGDLRQAGAISLQTFNNVMIWGFGRGMQFSDADIRYVSERAFGYLASGLVTQALEALVQLRGVGIARASKVIALSNQRELAIYDSHVANGLSDLLFDGARAVLIPPGRTVSGDTGIPQARFVTEYERFLGILKALRGFALQEPALEPQFRRISDLEIAFFARSRQGFSSGQLAAIAERRATIPVGVGPEGRERPKSIPGSERANRGRLSDVIAGLVSEGRLPRFWTTGHLLACEDLGEYEENTLKTQPANLSVSVCGTQAGNPVRNGQEALFYRFAPSNNPLKNRPMWFRVREQYGQGDPETFAVPFPTEWFVQPGAAPAAHPPARSVHRPNTNTPVGSVRQVAVQPDLGWRQPPLHQSLQAPATSTQPPVTQPQVPVAVSVIIEGNKVIVRQGTRREEIGFDALDRCFAELTGQPGRWLPLGRSDASESGSLCGLVRSATGRDPWFACALGDYWVGEGLLEREDGPAGTQFRFIE